MDGAWHSLQNGKWGFGTGQGSLSARDFRYKPFTENSYGNAILIPYGPSWDGVRKPAKKERPLWNCAATSNC